MVEDYEYYLEEDIRTYNYNNLGWWKYQTEELAKLGKSPKVADQQSGKRLLGYLNALLADYNDILKAEKVLDEEAIGLLYMIKTVIQPKDFDSYLKLISLSAKNEDYGTALFYLDELLVNGYANKETLYNLEHTALFRIMPEFNETVAKFLKEARYGIIEQ